MDPRRQRDAYGLRMQQLLASFVFAMTISGVTGTFVSCRLSDRGAWSASGPRHYKLGGTTGSIPAVSGAPAQSDVAARASPFLAGAIALYCLPLTVAGIRNHPHWRSIAIINLLTGWTLIGWLVALAMAIRTVNARHEAPLFATPSAAQLEPPAS